MLRYMYRLLMTLFVYNVLKVAKHVLIIEIFAKHVRQATTNLKLLVSRLVLTTTLLKTANVSAVLPTTSATTVTLAMRVFA